MLQLHWQARSVIQPYFNCGKHYSFEDSCDVLFGFEGSFSEEFLLPRHPLPEFKPARRKAS
eukprot:1144142-Pelagomonas_calceolata.AAC.3